ncbi:purine-binding chemotaxis protein CheW [Desulfobaculum xiamenense]|uniref:Purine-binding chemotaxis protein CheW n=1 Tax=Desulfobaculum xiamenense TaxID=995050 RepID=A0A846QR11_9BACT|nr:chemotaxis protein CheW [Desulfobaculum xiamenense]NJB69420.1 purine-binding chemotaxis protein CheW [Desulfobaculum xiamenense]
MKTPEEYFLEKNFLPENQGAELTEAEQAFLRKYLGHGDGADAQAALPHPARVQAAPGFSAPARAADTADEPDEPDLMGRLMTESSIQLVAFTLGGQEFTVPIDTVQEVIKYVTPTKLPAAPSFISGIVNLRGRVTPLIMTGKLMGIPGGEADCRFIVVCRRKGLQVGLLIETVKTMYRAQQKEIDWGVESHLGGNVEFVAGLLKAEGERLVGILSVDRIVDKVLKG